MERTFEMSSAAFVFPAVKGIQAQREYYISMVPLEVMAKIFQFADEELPPEVRSQRVLLILRFSNSCLKAAEKALYC